MKVSIIIPVYNRQYELDRSLKSLSRQTFKDFEVIVCDDGSDTPVTDVVERYSQEMPIKLIRIDNSGGPARPRNVALMEAQAPWISFLDSDDWWLPTRLEALMKCVTSDVDVVYHPLTVCSEGNKKTRLRQVGSPIVGNALYQMATQGNPIPLSGAIVRRALLDNQPFDESDLLKAYEDFDLWLRLAAQGAVFCYRDEPLGFYWEGADSISILSLSHIEKCKAIYEKHRNSYAKFKNEAISSHYLQLSSLYFRLGQYKQAISKAWAARSLTGWRNRIKRWLLLFASFIKSYK